ncbi:hydroxymethylbilane synthase [Rhodoglobus aureus]|uniref:Porphobilinogen deaminase n=1 Tax=Rhodoglobus aureus TaxID=191497 RepID=A0ABN1VGZ6_9MICO
MTVIRIGTRGSTLAMAQTTTVARALENKTGVETEIIPISTQGDRSTESLSLIGGQGVFANALRDALLAGECDIVVHSLKDLPTAEIPGLTIAAVPKRADERDVVCARDGLTLETLPAGARVGTGSPRRQAQLRSLYPELEVVDLRGNIDSRLDKVTDGHLDAVILAAAGLARAGRSDAVTEHLGIAGWPTAPGQGALAVEVRTGEEKLASVLDHKPSRTKTNAERYVLAFLDAGCSAPLGAHAVIDDGLLFLDARVYALDGSRYLTSSHALYVNDVEDPAREAAQRVADELLAQGAGDLTGARA